MVKTGLSNLLHNKINLLKGCKVGVLCHPASVSDKYQHIVDLLCHHNEVNLSTILSPQHGFRGEKQDNMIESSHETDLITKLPVYSLYSETRTPTKEMLNNIDILIIDLQDVGTRVYTFIYTMALCLKACQQYQKKVIILDRPNPINALDIEGNLLDSQFQSFVGLYPIPMRHGMTIGELGLLFNQEFNINCNLEVIKMTDYNRGMWYDETGLPWIYPSPNMPTLDTAVVYPGLVLFEGTGVSEGRGTTKPFELVGAPYIVPNELKEKLDSYGLPGVYFRPIYFEPTFHKFQGESCGGVQLHVTNRGIFKPYITGLAIIQALQHLYSDTFQWKQPPYEYEYEKLPIDLLIGDQNIRLKLKTDQSIKHIEDGWLDDLNQFSRTRNEYFIYPE